MAELKPAQPLSLEETLMQYLWGDDVLEHDAKVRIREAEQRANERPVRGLADQIPGGNPEAPTGADALLGILMSMGGVPPAVSRANIPSMQRPGGRLRPENSITNRRGMLGNLKDQVEGNLYRETSLEGLQNFLPGPVSPMSDMTMDQVYMATNPDLALGQGRNKGVVMELTPGPTMKGVLDRRKPSAPLMESSGHGEMVGEYNNQREYQNALGRFTIQKGAQTDKVTKARMLRAVIPFLIQAGWQKVENPDGSVTWTKPGHTPDIE